MRVIINQDITLAEDVRLVKRLYKVQANADFPLGLKFAYQHLLLKEGKWLEVCRIDNYRHDKHRAGTHIHKQGNEEVEFIDMGFVEAREHMLDLGKRMSDKLRWFDGKD